MNRSVKNKINEQRRQESLEKILGAALEVFVGNGFAGGSMSQIAKKAGVPQALIYHYFKNKEELWKSVKKDAFLKAGMTADFHASTAKDIGGFIRKALTNRFLFYQNNPALWRLIKWESLEGGQFDIVGLESRFAGPWAKELEALQNEGKIRKELDPKLIGILIRNAFFALLDDLPIFFHDDLVEKQNEYIDLIVDALAGAISS